MPVTSTTRADGTLLIEIPPGEKLTLLTQSELTREAGRSAEFVRNRVLDGTVSPIARTASGIQLFNAASVFALVRAVHYPAS